MKVKFSLHTTRTYTRSGGEIPLILNSALNVGEWSDSCRGRFVPCERALGAHRIGCERARAFCKRVNSLAPAGTRTPDHPTFSLVTIPTTLSRVPFFTTNYMVGN